MASNNNNFPYVTIAGVRVHTLVKAALREYFDQMMKAPMVSTLHLATTYSEFIVAAQKDEKFKNILNQAEVNTADGIGILWAASYLNRQYANPWTAFWGWFYSLLQILFAPTKIKNIIPEKISGADLIWDIAELAAENGQSLYLLGGYGDVAAPLLKKHPDLKIAGRSEDGPKKPGLVETINQSGADILLVAYGPVKQEKWIAENKPNLNVKLIAGLGGTFDYVIGKRKRAGEKWQKLGLEWLHRLITQPWRIKRMWKAIVVFSTVILKIKLSRQKQTFLSK